jgi:hypothetical protein
MATKTETKAPKATKTAKAPAAKAPTKIAKAAPKKTHSPKAALAAKGSKESVVAGLVPALSREGESADQLKTTLMKVSNSKLLRLVSVVDTVNKKFGNRAKLIDAIASAKKAGKDKVYVAKLGTMALPQLLDLGLSASRA